MSEWTDLEMLMITSSLDIRRYLNSDIIDPFGVWQMATLNYPNGYGHGPRVHEECISLTTGQQPCVKVNEKYKGEEKVRIRKLVPVECAKLMGFTRSDFEALRSIGQSDAQIYHEMGDSLVVPLFAMLIGQMLPISENYLKGIIENYIEEIKE